MPISTPPTVLASVFPQVTFIFHPNYSFTLLFMPLFVCKKDNGNRKKMKVRQRHWMKWTKKKVRMKTTDYRVTEGTRKIKGTLLLLVCAFAIWSTLHANKDVLNFGVWLCICVQHALFITVTLVCLCDCGWGEWRAARSCYQSEISPCLCLPLSLPSLWALHPTSCLHECVCVSVCASTSMW